MRSAANGASPLVVLAEDDTEMRRLVSTALRADGNRVEEAADGSELLELLDSTAREAESVDLVITDVRMPGLTGLQALDWLHQVRSRRPPTIIITAFPGALMYLRAEQLGARVLEKPFDLDDLRSLVRTLTRGQVKSTS